MLPVPSDEQLRRWIVPGAQLPPRSPDPSEELSMTPDVEAYRHWSRQQVPPTIKDLATQGYRFDSKKFEKWLNEQVKSRHLEDRRLYDPTTAGTRGEGA
jgi:hypothetical protein